MVLFRYLILYCGDKLFFPASEFFIGVNTYVTLCWVFCWVRGGLCVVWPVRGWKSLIG